MKSWNEIRKGSRKELVTLRDYSYGAQSAYWYSTDYDLIGRLTNATDSVSLMREWLYNNRSELAAAIIGTNLYGYAYDTIGNRLWSAANLATNTYIANALNQYASVGRGVLDPPQTSFAYDADGNIIESSGPLADVFTFGFSTKYHDRETGMIGYQQRVYSPGLGRWLNRDPIEEEGGENLYAFCKNNSVLYYDIQGHYVPLLIPVGNGSTPMPGAIPYRHPTGGGTW